MRRVEQREGPKGGGRCLERPEIQLSSRLDIGHKDFHGAQFVETFDHGAVAVNADRILHRSTTRPYK